METRLLSAFLAGMILCLSGSLCQLLTHNKMASSSTFGIDGFAVLIIILMFYLKLSSTLLSFSLIFIFYLILFFLVGLYFKTKKININANKMIMLGICFNLLVGAVFYLLHYLSMLTGEHFPAHLWYGDFRGHTLSAVVILLMAVLFLFSLNLWLHRRLSFLALGEEFCLAYAIDLKKIYLVSFFIIFLVVTWQINAFGVFSFLGLIFPHLVRTVPIVGASIKKELYLGPFLCGFFMLLVDQACYHFPYRGAEIPVGMVSAVLGSGFLIILLLKIKSINLK
jgi:iron complex transport system permease protein